MDKALDALTGLLVALKNPQPLMLVGLAIIVVCLIALSAIWALARRKS